ncbi:TPA: hypothetical protein QHT08_004162 [Escherichia coli]|nr:hypothetical protein [Escherichia coli]
MTKVLIIRDCGEKFYGIVSPNGVKIVSYKPNAIRGAGMSASFQMVLYGCLTEKQFRNRWKVIGSFMVKHAK